jgi:pilus assembly protein Flp/PilA
MPRFDPEGTWNPGGTWNPEGTWKEMGEIQNRLILKFWRDETGATAIEYGLIATGISLAIVSVINGLGSRLSSKFVSVDSSLK